MIDNLVLNPLPYVDGLPTDVKQQAIAWIKNGDPLLGASTKTGHDGQLNAAALCIQTNVETLEVNSILTKIKVNEVSSEVNRIVDALGVIEDVTSVKQIGINTNDIADLKVKETANETEIASVKTTVSNILSDVGSTDETPKRNIRVDLNWIKNEMGQYENQDINGNTVNGNTSTGLKRRVLSNTQAISEQNIRISDVEESLNAADLPGLNKKISDIRVELGTAPGTNTPQVYTRLTNLENSDVLTLSAIDSIKLKIDFNNAKTLASRVQTVESSVSGLGTIINAEEVGLVDRVEVLENEVAGSGSNSLSSKVTKNTSDIASLSKSVGTSDAEGLRKEVIWIEQQIGSTSAGGTPAVGSILNRLSVLTSNNTQNASAIQDIQTDIGNNTEGLKGRVNTLTTKMDGNGSGNTIEGLGVFAYSKSLGTSIAAKIDEANSDGKSYVRRNKAWVPLVSSIASLSLANSTITLLTSDTPISLSDFQESSLNSGVTVSTGLTVASAGFYKIKLESEVASLTGKVQFTVKVGANTVATLKRYVKDSTDSFVFGSVEELVKLSANDIVTVTVKALDDESAVSTALNNIKLTLIPVAM